MPKELGLIDVWVCNECESTDVEIRVWKNLKTGGLEDCGDGHSEDTYCNNCEEHTGIKTKQFKSGEGMQTQLQGLTNFCANIKPTMLKLKDNTSPFVHLSYSEAQSVMQFYLEVMDYLSKQS